MTNWTIKHSFKESGADVVFKTFKVVTLGGPKGAPGSLRIDGFFVDPVGKTDVENWELDDEFWGWSGDRYVVGKILNVDVPIDMPTDLDDANKIGLAVNQQIYRP